MEVIEDRLIQKSPGAIKARINKWLDQEMPDFHGTWWQKPSGELQCDVVFDDDRFKESGSLRPEYKPRWQAIILIEGDTSEMRVVFKVSAPTSFNGSNDTKPRLARKFTAGFSALLDSIEESTTELSKVKRKKSEKPKPQDRTKRKLIKLHELREDYFRSGIALSGWVSACQQVGVNEETAKNYLPDLHARWDEKEYRPDPPEFSE